MPHPADYREAMVRTKIITTVGPACARSEQLPELVLPGVERASSRGA